MAVRVDVVKIRPITGKGNLQGFASIQIAGKMVIHDCRIIQQPNQRAWVSPPQNSYTNKENKVVYTPLVEWPKEWSEDINEAVLGAFFEGAQP